MFSWHDDTCGALYDDHVTTKLYIIKGGGATSGMDVHDASVRVDGAAPRPPTGGIHQACHAHDRHLPRPRRGTADLARGAGPARFLLSICGARAGPRPAT